MGADVTNNCFPKVLPGGALMENHTFISVIKTTGENVNGARSADTLGGRGPGSENIPATIGVMTSWSR